MQRCKLFSAEGGKKQICQKTLVNLILRITIFLTESEDLVLFEDIRRKLSY